MKTFKFNGGWGYENHSYIAKGWQDEPILVDGGACCEFYERSTIFIGSHEELTKLWQNLAKDTDRFGAYYTPNFGKDIDYCIEICKQDQFGVHNPAMCYVHKVANICWDYYKNVTSFEQMKQDRQNLYLEWLQDHMAWEQCRKEVK